MEQLGWMLSALAVVGTLVLFAQWLALWWHRRVATSPASDFPGVSILKPLCGLDEDLEDNLRSFAALAYPQGRVEILLGVRSQDDAGYPLAQSLVAQHPDRFRCIVQDGEPGLNPKVNQLLTLERHARFPLLVISDSNVRVPSDYLEELTGHFSDPTVGCVSHPVAGNGARSWGALFDNLHLTASVAPGMVAAQRIRKDLVVGKSMALWRHDLEALGGFLSVKDVLAEDHVLGKRIGAELGKRVVISSRVVENVAGEKTVRAFFQRYRRWAVIHRTAVTPVTYFAEGLLNPGPFAIAGWLVAPSWVGFGVLASVCLAKVALDLACAWLLRGPRGWRSAVAVPAKDTLLMLAWWYGLFVRRVNWRGNRLRVAAGSRLVPLEA